MPLEDSERNNLLNQTSTLLGAVYALGVQLAVPTSPILTLIVRAKLVESLAKDLRAAFERDLID